MRPWQTQDIDPGLAVAFVERLGPDLQDADCPPEINQLGRTQLRWKHQIAAWQAPHVSNRPTEAVNNLVKRVKRVAFGMTTFDNYRTRAPLYAGRPNWDSLATIKKTLKSEEPVYYGPPLDRVTKDQRKILNQSGASLGCRVASWPRTSQPIVLSVALLAAPGVRER